MPLWKGNTARVRPWEQESGDMYSSWKIGSCHEASSLFTHPK